MLGVQAVLTTLVLGLSVRWGVGRLGSTELLMLAIAGIGVAGWAIVSDPLVATLCIIGADLVGVVLMAPKAWRDPTSETGSTYALAAVSGVLAAGAVGSLELALLLYPIYYALANGAIALVIRVRRGHLAVPPLHPWRSIA